METISITRHRFHETRVHGKPLGRHIRHDSRSRQYPVRAEGEPARVESVSWRRVSPVLDQGNLGSCTGNAADGVLGSEPFYDTLANLAGGFDFSEATALKIYSKGTELDGYPGSYPPDDTGSDGLAVAQACKGFGWISGYTHAFSMDDFLTGMTKGPAITGSTWLTGMDSPDPQGLVTFSGTVRGGHEFEADGIDATNEIVWFVNSWGTGWGQQGRFGMRFAEYEKALADGGDATFFVPLSQPAPTPTPTPGDPVDAALIGPMDKWAATVFSRFTRAGKAKVAYETWKQAKGY